LSFFIRKIVIHHVMVAERIEQLKREYTDKYVKVDAERPELARFRDVVGQIKTVNMNGRALVEFLDYHLNIGWYDVDLSCLEIVDKPPPKVEKKPEAKKPAEKPAPKAAPAKAEGAKPAAKPAGGKPSVADILAAARAGKSAAPAAKTESSAPASPASAGGGAAEKPAAPKADRSKMSVADILAAARGGAAAAPAKPAAIPPEPEPEAPPAEKPPAAAAPPAAAPAAAAPAKPAGPSAKVDRNSMSTDDKIAYCRAKDAK
jgi:hypothetical protein